MNGEAPIVSVLMPVYNGMPWLPLAVESIRSQSFTDFEFIIVDDCSTDTSGSYLQSIPDPRIILVTLAANTGVTGALQAGMAKVRGNYIARLDADDIAKPERLSTQVAYLEAHPAIGIMGSGYEVIDTEGNVQPHQSKEKDDLDIRWEMLFKNPFFHSTVMFRKALIDQHHLGYTRKHAEDYQLWLDLLSHTQGIIVRDQLIYYRRHTASWTHTKKTEQALAGEEIYSRQLSALTNIPGEVPDFVSWVRGKGMHEGNGAAYVSAYVKLVRHFTALRGERAMRFYRARLQWLRRNVSLRYLVRWDVIALHIRTAF